jgi:glycosyltransferase involved in cell wall biosynthesis
MPWRMIINLTREMCIQGHDAQIVSINQKTEAKYSELCDGVPIRIYSSVDELRNEKAYNKNSSTVPDIVFWPVTWRNGIKWDGNKHSWDCCTIAYHGGGCYKLNHVLRAALWMNPCQLKSYLIDCLTPKRLLANKLSYYRINGAICITDYTRRRLIQAGYSKDKTTFISPGYNPQVITQKLNPSSKQLITLCQDKPYVLYLGNPLPIRGLGVLARSAKTVLNKNKNIRILCLLRSDPGKEIETAKEKVLRYVLTLKERERFICITDKLKPSDIMFAIKQSQAVVMPFLLVPSEIPLAILEAMQHGTPVITTRSGGTSEFVGQAGYIIPPANSKALANAILSVFQNPELNKKKAYLARQKMSNHPSWPKTAKSWVDFAIKQVRN